MTSEIYVAPFKTPTGQYHIIKKIMPDGSKFALTEDGWELVPEGAMLPRIPCVTIAETQHIVESKDVTATINFDYFPEGSDIPQSWKPTKKSNLYMAWIGPKDGILEVTREAYDEGFATVLPFEIEIIGQNFMADTFYCRRKQE